MEGYEIFLATVCACVTAVSGKYAIPQMYSNQAYILENEDYNIFCVTQADATRWRVDNADNTHFAVIQYYNNECTASNFIINNTTSFAYSCHNDSNTIRYTLTLKNVQVSQNKQKWFCSYVGSNSGELVVNVSVLVKNVTIESGGHVVSSALTLQENDGEKIACTSSLSIPRANVTWYVTERANADKIFLPAQNLTHTWQGQIVDFESTTSTLLVNFNRTYNGWVLVCEAENIQDYASVSKNVSLNITYSTNKPIIHCTNNGIYKVIQNTKGNLTCSVDGGYPAGILQWNCTGNVTSDQVHTNKVTQTVVWNATETRFCTCNYLNIAGNKSTTVKTEVLYPPVIEEMQNITVFEGDTVTLHCYVTDANPSVYEVRWISNNHSALNATLTIKSVLRSDETVYTCTANNSMNTTCKGNKLGSTSKDLHVEVLYPPCVNITDGETFTVEEGHVFNYTCPVVPGNPPSTNITWRKSNDTKTWSGSQLLIHNVTRKDDSVYTCYATYKMEISNGTKKEGNVSADIRLNVTFKTSVTEFYIRNHTHKTSVSATENTKLTFDCRLQSNPTADVRIYETATLVNRSRADELLHFTTTTCIGRPVNYSCYGNNSLNNKPSMRLIELSVNCIPRQDMNADVEFNVTSAINQTVTLSYTALAYPHPSFVWSRNGLSLETQDVRITISSAYMQANITISRVEESDFGEYTLTVKNDLGTTNESFHLNPDGVPEVPTHLTQDAIGTTISSIAINWRSGFNNGSEQIFTVMYSTNTEEKWQNTTIQDTGPTGTTIHHTITGLPSGSGYDIVLFAVNAKGRSKYNATLSCSTMSIEGPTASTNTSPIVLAIAGVILSGLVVLCGIVFSIFIYRRGYLCRIVNSSKTNEQQECSTSQSPVPVTYENLKINQLPNDTLEYQRGSATSRAFETNMDHTYEGLSREVNDQNLSSSCLNTSVNVETGKENEYMHLGNDIKDDPKPTYENLKIQL